MGFSSVAVEQREKELKALKSFLLYSLICSLGLHIGILALGISKFLQRVPETKDQPIEITIIETVPQKVTKPQEIQKSQLKINSGGGGSLGGSNNNPKSSISAATAIRVTNPSLTPIVKQPQTRTIPEPAITPPTEKTTPIEKITPEPTTTQPIRKTTPIEKLTEKLETPATTQPTPDQTVIPNTKLSNNVEAPKSTTPVSVTSNNTSRSPLSGNTSSNLGNRLRNGFSKGTKNGDGNGTGNGVGNGQGNGTGNSGGNEVENKPKKEDTPVATAPKPPQENGSKLNRADCIRCDIKYPDRARRRGIEGKAEVAIDTDAHGNVTLVRLIRSSGDSELDEAAQQAAQEWKLKPTDAGRQGVRASVNFAIQGSQRHRKLQERRRETQREAAQKKPEKDASTPTPPSQPVKSDTNNQADESRTEEVAAPSSTTPPESNKNSENSN
ncbi:TonB family protein [Anabaena sphaerica FACHB-251]|uniref:TonB family protein n=1 Tax=Anabaena sphaerica FACHB-251 TaxID=2692883 RepID=A0A926WHK7_9NOST|nr:energy transducer TonB [Anabaena sphaerica]MBD2294699.1 TonB family protein [Anabaena sphaerica FACHB-251]